MKITVLALILAGSLLAQDGSTPPAPKPTEVEQLRAQVKALEAKLAKAEADARALTVQNVRNMASAFTFCQEATAKLTQSTDGAPRQ